MISNNRREFLRHAALLSGAAFSADVLARWAHGAEKRGEKMNLGFCTYLWGEDWDLPTLIANCEKSGILGVETRTEHRHGVEPNLNEQQRAEVRKRFADSRVKFLGPGTNEAYHYAEPEKLSQAIERTKAFIKLSHDCGGTGVKVKPNDLPKGVPVEKTIEQIGRSLEQVGKFAADYGQEIRLEVHGGCSELPVIKQIMDHVQQSNVGVCWNCNDQDLHGKGLADNFNLVKNRFGQTAHVRELNVGDYPYAELIQLFVEMDYAGWVLLECRTKPSDRVAAMKEQLELFEKMVAAAQAKV